MAWFFSVFKSLAEYQHMTTSADIHNLTPMGKDQPERDQIERVVRRFRQGQERRTLKTVSPSAAWSASLPNPWLDLGDPLARVEPL
jgi:hypothetical protein